MRLDVPYKFLDIEPSVELLNFDFNLITLNEWLFHKKLRETFPIFREVYNFRILGLTSSQFEAWRNPSVDIPIEYFNSENSIHPLILQEVKKLEELYNARAVVGVLDGMPPGSCIYRHYDMNPVFQKSHRVHLPLVTHPDVKFYIDDVEHHFQAGKFFEFDNQRFHEVKNNSNIFRIHLVVDLLPL